MNPTVGRGYWFKSRRFEVEPGEDEDQPASLRASAGQLAAPALSRARLPCRDRHSRGLGLVRDVAARSLWLFVACVNLRDYEYAKRKDPPPPKERLLWNVVPMAQTPFLKYLFFQAQTRRASRLDEARRRASPFSGIGAWDRDRRRVRCEYLVQGSKDMASCQAPNNASAREVVAMIVDKVRAGVGWWAGGERGH